MTSPKNSAGQRSLYPVVRDEDIELSQYRNGQSTTVSYGSQSSYLQLFHQFDRDGDGYIPLRELKEKVEAASDALGLSDDQRDSLLNTVDFNKDNLVDFGEFCYMMSRAKNQKVQMTVYRAAQLVVPKHDREEKFNYLEQYSCIPPPLFMILITLVEVILYIVYVVEMKASVSVSGPVPIYSPLIYDPYRRYQAWRYLTYMFIHIGIYHILFNSLTQLALGVPLELVHKFWRVGIVYLAGVIAGSLAVSVCDPNVFLAGASGGVYALISAHVSNLILNWQEMEFAIFRLVFLVILIGSDFGIALYNRYGKPESAGDKVSYVAHIGGFIAGLLMGIVVLRNFKKRTWERVVWWVALVGFLLLVVLCILWNIFYPQYPTQKYDPLFEQKQVCGTGPYDAKC